MSDDDEGETSCPLCMEELDLSDKNFLPCSCGYKVCMWCWHHIRENLNGLCPACRTPYNADPHAFNAVDREEIVKKNRERKQKEKNEKKTDRPIRPVIQTVADRRLLHNYRVIQRNLVYVIGIPATYASEDVLRKPEFFGQYGKIGKIVIHRNHAPGQTSVSAYVTFAHKDDAKAAIQALEAFWLDGHILRASFGTTKYCNSFIRGVTCSNPECVYLHEIGDDEDRFTKEEIQAGQSKLVPVPGRDQVLITGNGGPSGTGKRPAGDPVLPAPVFIQETNQSANRLASTTAAAAAVVTAPPSTQAQSATTLPRSTSWNTPNSILSSSNNNTNENVGLGGTRKASESFGSDYGNEGDAMVNGSNSLGVTSGKARGATSGSSFRSEYNNGDSPPSSNAVPAAAALGPQGGIRVLQKANPGSNSPSTATMNIVGSVSPSLFTLPSNGSNNPPPTLLGGTSSSAVGAKPIASKVVPSEATSVGAIANGAPVNNATTRQQRSANSAFNGFGHCAVFPVPVSSLAASVWSNILSSASSDLTNDPFDRLGLPISELLDLTLPPVDAVCITPWPRPLVYYRKGIDSDSTDQYGVNSVPRKPPTIPRPNNSAAVSTQGIPAIAGAKDGRDFLPMEKGLQQSTAAPQRSDIATLQQLFPSVKMSIGLPGTAK